MSEHDQQTAARPKPVVYCSAVCDVAASASEGQARIAALVAGTTDPGSWICRELASALPADLRAGLEEQLAQLNAADEPLGALLLKLAYEEDGLAFSPPQVLLAESTERALQLTVERVHDEHIARYAAAT